MGKPLEATQGFRIPVALFKYNGGLRSADKAALAGNPEFCRKIAFDMGNLF